MMIDKRAVTEFKQIYLDEFGVELSDEKATEKATALLNVFKVLAEPKNELLLDKIIEVSDYEN